MKKLIYLILILSIFTTSCSQDDDNVTTPKLLTKTIEKFNNGTVYKITEFNYDGNKLIQLIFKDGNDNLINKGTIEYNADLPVRINKYDENDNLIEYVLIVYEANQLTKYTEYNSINNTANKYLISYSANGITKKIYTGNFTTQDNYFGTKNYEINNDNITKVISDNYTITYTYDNSNGIFKNIASKTILNIMGRLHNPLDFGTNNNATSYEYIHGDILDHINLNYSYDVQNYPVILQEVSTDFGDSNIIEYEYN